jgi:hypothetical protein
MDKFDCKDTDFADRLVQWSETIRKTYADGGVDDIISTRRLCHITQTFAIFKDRAKSIDLCISRFDTDTKEAFKDLYAMIDESINTEITANDNISIDDMLDTALDQTT